LNRYVSTLTENTSEQGDNKPLVSFIKEYILLPFSLGVQTPGWQADLERLNPSGHLAAAYSIPISPPPESPGVFRIVWVPEYHTIKKGAGSFWFGFLAPFLFVGAVGRKP
jgi:hypothetical protein